MSSRAAWVRSGVMAGDLGCTHISTAALTPPIARPLQKWKNTARAAAGRAPGELEISMAAAEPADAAAARQPWQLHRLARQRLPLARDQGRGARRGNLSRLRRRRASVR